MVFEKLHSADAAVVTKQPQRRDKVEHQPASGELLDDIVLLFAEQSEDQNRTDRRQPGNN